MRPFKVGLLLALLAVTLPLALSIAVAEERVGQELNPTRILIFHDRTHEAHLLWYYNFRVLVVEDLVGSGGLCWRTLENGTTIMDTSVCRPLSNVRLRIWYSELKESVEVYTDEGGVAETGWRIFTYPRATFRVLLETPTDVVERWFTVESRPWTLAAVMSFSAMLSSMVYVLRRGVW
ncbi:MAG: hypothetical protein QXD32_07400 [Nitrososphaerota archaeon]